MKIFKILHPLILVALFMSGCGSNSKAGPIFHDPNSGGSTGEVNGYQLVNITVPFDIHYAGEAKKFKVQLLKDDIPVIGAKIQVAGLPAEFGLVTKSFADTDDSGYATFSYIAADPLVNGVYPLDVFYDGSLSTETAEDENATNSTVEVFRITTKLQINVQESSEEGAVGGKLDYTLVNITNPFLVTYISEEKTFAVQVLKDSIPATGESVSVAALPSQYGVISPATAISNESGYALFNYLAPNPLTNGSYDLELSHIDANGSEVNNNLYIVVDEGAQEFTYQLTNASTPVILSEPNQQGSISVYLVDNLGIGVIGKTVNISILDNAYGTLASTVAITDESGKASFSYIASSNLVGLGSTVLTATFMENGLSTTQNIEVKSESTFDYKLVNLTTPLMVTSPLQSSSITIQLVNQLNQPIAGKDVSITALDVKYGSISPAVSKTDASGTATFAYSGPESLLDLTTTQSTVIFTENGLSTSETLTIAMALDFDYKLTNLTTPIMVKAPSEKHKISIQLIDKNSQGIVGKDIAISAVDATYGFITPTVSTTDASGTAVFDYTAPTSLIGLGNTQSTLSFTESDLTISELLTISVETAFDYKFSNPTTPLILKTPKQESEIGVYLVDSNGLGIPNKDVSITTIDINYGLISPTTVQTDQSGRAIYQYIGPESLNGLTSTPATFSFTESDLIISESLTISVQTAFNYQFINPTTPILIQTPKQEIEVGVYLVDSNGLGIPDKEVSVTTIDGAYGSISPTTIVTDKSGRAIYTYIGPDSLSGLKSTFAKFSFTESDLTIYADMEIKVSAIGGGTDYKLVNATTPIGVNMPNQTADIEVQLVRNGLPVIDVRKCDISSSTVIIDCIMPEAIPRSYGRIIDAGGTTGKSGYVLYKYEGPNINDKADVGTEHIFNIIYFDEEGQPKASTPVSIEMNF